MVRSHVNVRYHNHSYQQCARLTQNGFESTARTGADGRTINTANIGTNRPNVPKIFVNGYTPSFCVGLMRLVAAVAGESQPYQRRILGQNHLAARQ